MEVGFEDVVVGERQVRSELNVERSSITFRQRFATSNSDAALPNVPAVHDLIPVPVPPPRLPRAHTRAGFHTRVDHYLIHGCGHTFVTNGSIPSCERHVGFSRGVIVAKRNMTSSVTLIARRAFTWSVFTLVAVLGPHVSNSSDILVLLKERFP
jgi:hypothetical protein